MPISPGIRARMAEKLRLLYREQAEETLSRIDRLADRYVRLRSTPPKPLWDECTVALITYADQICGERQSPLGVLKDFLLQYKLERVIRLIHLLPFFPYSSDDGFSVIDYRQVDPQLGTWSDVDRLSRSFRLMFDFVLNHCSQQHQSFQGFLRGEPRVADHFIEVDPRADLTAVVRPRSTPVLSPFQTAGGTKYVWTTFSADQIDLNYANPDVLLEMLDTMLFYVQRGANVIRMDAIAYLWKTIGTACVHLPQTHAIVKLMRDLLEDLAPGTIILTETNVPHEENISYFGIGDEAHAVYQFSLAPLLLDAYLTQDASALNAWLTHLEPPRRGTTFFNFTASHDGIGVRPLEGLVSQDRVDALVRNVIARGGQISTKSNPDSSESPYELNISYFSALDSAEGLPAEIHARKFLASQGVMLALQGLPGIYFHSLVGTPNYTEGVEKTGRARTINRRKFQMDELSQVLNNPRTAQSLVFDGYRRMLSVRIRQPAFHPDAPQTVVHTGNRSVISFLRTSLDGDQQILVMANVSGQTVDVDLSGLTRRAIQQDLLGKGRVQESVYHIPPYGIAWLS